MPWCKAKVWDKKLKLWRQCRLEAIDGILYCRIPAHQKGGREKEETKKPKKEETKKKPKKDEDEGRKEDEDDDDDKEEEEEEEEDSKIWSEEKLNKSKQLEIRHMIDDIDRKGVEKVLQPYHRAEKEWNSIRGMKKNTKERNEKIKKARDFIYGHLSQPMENHGDDASNAATYTILRHLLTRIRNRINILGVLHSQSETEYKQFRHELKEKVPTVNDQLQNVEMFTRVRYFGGEIFDEGRIYDQLLYFLELVKSRIVSKTLRSTLDDAALLSDVEYNTDTMTTNWKRTEDFYVNEAEDKVDEAVQQKMEELREQEEEPEEELEEEVREQEEPEEEEEEEEDEEKQKQQQVNKVNALVKTLHRKAKQTLTDKQKTELTKSARLQFHPDKCTTYQRKLDSSFSEKISSVWDTLVDALQVGDSNKKCGAAFSTWQSLGPL